MGVMENRRKRGERAAHARRKEGREDTVKGGECETLSLLLGVLSACDIMVTEGTSRRSQHSNKH